MQLEPRDPENISIIQISDTHLLADADGRFDDVNTRQTLHQVLNSMQQSDIWPPDLVLATGDLAQQPIHETYEVLLQQFQELSVPVFCLPGNHDQPAILSEVLNQGMVSTQKQIFIGPWQLLLLDSHQPDTHSGLLAETELEWLAQQLNHYPENPTLVAVHHHPISIHSVWMDSMIMQNGDEFFALLQQHPQVKTVIFGHIHQAFQETHQHITFMGVPSTCVQFKPGVERFTVDQIAPGFRYLQLSAEGLIKTQICRCPYKKRT